MLDKLTDKALEMAKEQKAFFKKWSTFVRSLNDEDSDRFSEMVWALDDPLTEEEVGELISLGEWGKLEENKMHVAIREKYKGLVEMMEGK